MADEMDTLDEFINQEGSVRSSPEELAELLGKDETLFASSSLSDALSASFCSWTVNAPDGQGGEPQRNADEDGVLTQVKLFSSKCMATVSALRANLARFDVYAASAEKKQLEREIELLLGEAATWDLVYFTMKDLRDAEKDSGVAIRDGKWISDEQFFQQACRSDEDMRRWRRVVMWLEQVYSAQKPTSAGVRSDSYWENTSRHLSRGIDIEEGGDRSLISKIDPDAPLREKTRKLHSQDENLDNRLVKRVWELVRAGRIGQAVSECNACQQQWRSATLMGMQGYHDPKIVRSDDPCDARGNSNAANLRFMCSKIAEKDGINAYERALYGLFAGNVTPALAVSPTYHDQQWARYKVNLLQKMLQLRGLEHGPVHSDEEILADSSRAVFTGSDNDDDTAARFPFAQIQKSIILGQLNELVQMLESFQSSSSDPILIRFATHLLLVLSKVRVPGLNPEPNLILADAHQAIGRYVSSEVSRLDSPAMAVSLGLHLTSERRIECVANFIAVSVEGATNASVVSQSSSPFQNPTFSLLAQTEAGRAAEKKKMRRLRHIHALEAGGLDTVEILLRVVLNLLPESSKSTRTYNFGGDQIVGAAPTEADFMGSHLPLVEVLGWLTIRFEHWKESVFVANQIARNLALRHRVSDIKDVLRALPEVTLDQCRQACLDENNRQANVFAFEIEYWRTLCDAYDSFADWQVARLDQDPAFDEVHALYLGCEANLRRVVDFPEFPLFSGGAMDLRRSQLFLIRDAMVPQLYFMLHHLHYNMNQFDASLQLANDVADQRRRTWTIFQRSNGRLDRFMALMKDSAVALYATGKADFLGYDE